MLCAAGQDGLDSARGGFLLLPPAPFAFAFDAVTAFLLCGDLLFGGFCMREFYYLALVSSGVYLFSFAYFILEHRRIFAHFAIDGCYWWFVFLCWRCRSSRPLREGCQAPSADQVSFAFPAAILLPLR